jgi:hypothetical protein
MKAKIKINQGLDFITLDSSLENRPWGIVSRWAVSGKTLSEKTAILDTAKAHLFNETWKLTEMGYKVEVIPYIN